MTARLAKYWWAARISLTGQLIYAWDLLGRSLFFVVVLLVFSQLWEATAGEGALGLTANQLLWYLVITEIIMLSTPAANTLGIDDDIKSGNIAYLINRPYNYPLFMLGRYWGESLGKMAVNAAVGSVTALLLVGPPAFSPAVLAVFPLVVVLAVTLKFYFSFLVSLTAFWVEESGPFHWIYSKLLFTIGGLFIPLEFFPGWLQQVARALPFNLMLYAPARVLVSWDVVFFRNVVLSQAAWLIVAVLAAQLLFAGGVKKLNVHGG